ncbi:glycosyltransferase family 4 protein [Glaciimonas sp. Gout2]|uniref:glycosyltransferase family 4 protein n=1 Tax=unclassified Glaciimonas TaxID=2644401 RepID=UPI002B23788C|nr:MULTISPECIES: glycosyltransferase family 4 protein [unclassified Glaciimonas]MEB0014187.1 glycosyltransferase family 4 protein [Glaciimonas sp. Cout2]MEB0084361.1 glycosyltransferase family 4 protein [Glaciimonas sp. Gout2]
MRSFTDLTSYFTSGLMSICRGLRLDKIDVDNAGFMTSDGAKVVDTQTPYSLHGVSSFKQKREIQDSGLERVYRLAVISKQAFSISNFRGPLIEEMVSKGIKVFALAPDFDDATRAAVVMLGAVPIDSSMSPIGMNPFRDTVDLFKMVAQLKRLKIDITFTYFIKPVIYGTLAARLAAVPKRFAMIEGAGYVFTDDEKKLSKRRRILRILVKGLYRLGLSQVDRVFLLNSDDKALFINEKMVRAEKVELLDGIGLNLNHFYFAPPLIGQVCFILIARLLKDKGVYDFIAAARTVKISHPNVRFLLLGEIDQNPSAIVEAEIHSWVSEGLIEWPGHVSDVRTWILQASVFVLPSYREGLPRSTQEAMAMGRAVITTDVPGCRETVLEGVNGFMIPVRRPEALAKAMLAFVSQPELIAPMGLASRQIAENRFDVQKINAQILASMGHS